MRYFKTHQQTEPDKGWGTRRENCQNFSAPILTSHFCSSLYIFFSFLRAMFGFRIPDGLWRCCLALTPVLFFISLSYA